MISLIFLALAHNVSPLHSVPCRSFFCTYSLSVSNINSMATVTWEDFLSTRYGNVKDKQQLNAIKYLAFIYAVIILGIAYCVGFLSGIIESAMLTGSATTGPLVGAFLLAMLVPIANSKVRPFPHMYFVYFIAAHFGMKHIPNIVYAYTFIICMFAIFSFGLLCFYILPRVLLLA